MHTGWRLVGPQTLRRADFDVVATAIGAHAGHRNAIGHVHAVIEDQLLNVLADRGIVTVARADIDLGCARCDRRLDDVVVARDLDDVAAQPIRRRRAVVGIGATCRAPRNLSAMFLASTLFQHPLQVGGKSSQSLGA
jgi:hypothetical protein